MQFLPENAIGMLELDDVLEDNDEVVSPIRDVMTDMNVSTVQLGGRSYDRNYSERSHKIWVCN